MTDKARGVQSTSPRRRWVSAFVLGLILAATFAPPAFAYLDPGTGSYVFQMIMALVISFGFAVRTFWGRIRAALSRLARKRGGDDEPRA